MKKYKHLLFDLDHTLWDFHTNSMNTLQELFDHFKLGERFDGFQSFYSTYEVHNVSLWEQYRRGSIRKKELNFERFFRPLKEVGFDDPELARRFGNAYVEESPAKTALMPHTLEVLEYLFPHYELHIITNGFKEVQERKLEKSGLMNYFNKVFISELIGRQKPDRYFFEYVIKSLNAHKCDSMVIGDSLEADIAGAMNYGLDHIFYNPQRLKHEVEVMHEIHSLNELKGLL
jgi:putative hydrolase of the HAD superfamily